MANVATAILGLGRLGTSVGLALKRSNEQGGEHTFTITAYDGTPANVKAARELGAVDDTASRLDNAVRGKDIVVIAMPYAEVKRTYEDIGGSLRPGGVVLDMSPLSGQSMEWAKKYLKPDAYTICLRPVVNPDYLFDGVDEARRATADYFDRGTMLIMPSVSSNKDAIQLADDFAGILGARRYFVDPHEDDSLVTALETLPALIGVTYFYQMMRNNGWNDLQRTSNPVFGMLTHHLFDTHPDDLRDLILADTSGLLRHLDEYIDTLRSVRKLLATDDHDSIEGLLSDSSKEFEAWVNRRHNNRWQDDDKLNSKTQTAGSFVGNMMGGFLTSRLRRDNNGDEEKD